MVGGETILEVIAVGGELEKLLVAAVTATAAIFDVTVDQIVGGQRLGRLLRLLHPVIVARRAEIVQSSSLNRRRTQSGIFFKKIRIYLN